MSKEAKPIAFDSEYPSIESLRARARRKIPRFAMEYLDSGCNENINLHRNTQELRQVQLIPYYLNPYNAPGIKKELFGHTYDAPFGIAPVGLQGLMWPNAPEILAKAAYEHNIPFILSTVSTSSIERISEITHGRAWFQLYHPTDDGVRDDFLKRAQVAGCPVLVVLADVPTFGFRPKEIRNGLAIPPKMSMRNIMQILGRPDWATQTLVHGQPSFENLTKYMPQGMNLRQLGKFMNATFNGQLDERRIRSIRDKWKGKLVLKGVASEEDAEKAIQWGFDGIIVSNHGGRQLDAGESTIKPMTRISQKYRDQITIMMDSGLRSGPDIARTMASGAEFSFLGRSFMYGVSALGKKGGDHTISLLKVQLQQVMDQLCCERIEDLPKHLVKF